MKLQQSASPVHPRDRCRAALLRAALLILALGSATAMAGSGVLDSLSTKEASAGLRAALAQGIENSVGRLGAPNGFLNNPEVAIPLPGLLAKAERALQLIGEGEQAEALKAAMNHAAEEAVAQARPVLKQALQHLTLADAKGILSGGDDSATRYFRQATGDQLAMKFRPIVARATSKVKLGALYDRVAGRAADLGLVSRQDADLDDYVTAKALDGLFLQIAEEERAIRKDPLGQASTLIRKVFGAR